MSKNYCKNCGTENDEDAKFCVRCGITIDYGVPSKKAVSNNYSLKDSSNAVGDYSSYVQIIAVLEIAYGVIIFVISSIVWFLAINLPKLINHIDDIDPEFTHFWPLIT